MNFCKDCTHHFRVGGDYLCHQYDTAASAVIGTGTFTIRRCGDMRDPNGACGPEGRLWVKRPSWWRRLLTYLFVSPKAGW